MDYINKMKQLLHIDNGQPLVLKTCPECFVCFYGDPNPEVKLEKCKECSKENKDG